jgi:hypothetical protein
MTMFLKEQVTLKKLGFSRHKTQFNIHVFMFQLVKMSFHQLLILAYQHCRNAPYYSKFTLEEVWSSSTPVKIINAGVPTAASIFPQHYDEESC